MILARWISRVSSEGTSTERLSGVRRSRWRSAASVHCVELSATQNVEIQLLPSAYRSRPRQNDLVYSQHKCVKGRGRLALRLSVPINVIWAQHGVRSLIASAVKEVFLLDRSSGHVLTSPAIAKSITAINVYKRFYCCFYIKTCF